MKKNIFITMVAIPVLFASLFLSEIISRVFFPQWAPARAERETFWIYDSLLGWSNKPNVTDYFVNPSFRVKVSINSKGLRSKECSLDRTAKKRILILGDSFGWGFGVPDEDVFSEILQKMHPEWEIINASVSGYGTDQEFLYLKARGIKYRPDVVLLLFCEGDLARNMLSEAFRYYKPVFKLNNGALELTNCPVPEATIRQKMDRFFFGKTYFLSKLYDRINRIYAKIKKKTLFDYSNIYEPGTWVITARLFSEIKTLLSNNGSEFILVSIPMRSDEPKIFLENISKKDNFRYLALDKSFSMSDEKVTIENDEHWNSRGHEVAAEAIEKFLISSNIF